LLLRANSADQTAVAFVESTPVSPGGPARYSPRIDAIWADCEKLEKETGDACLEFSMLVMGNDADVPS
jgi:hypothetical protein